LEIPAMGESLSTYHPNSSIENPQNLSHFSSSQLPFCYHPNPQVLKMPQAELRNNSPEIKEPSHKIPKLQQNGVNEAAPIPSSLLKVKKLSESAALPSRCSLLAAGYDLFRY